MNQESPTKCEYFMGDRKLEIIKGHIIQYAADALVSSFHLGSGSNNFFAFAEAGADTLLGEARDIANTGRGTRYPTCIIAVTGAGKFPASKLIHLYSGATDRPYDPAQIVRESTNSVLQTVVNHGLRSVGFPVIDLTTCSNPLEMRIEAMLNALVKHLQGKTIVERVGLIVDDNHAYATARKICTRKV